MKRIDSILPEHQMMLKRIGQRLKEMRKNRGISYIVIAQEIGISRNTYNLMENGKINFQFATLLQIIDYYEKSVSDFFSDV